MAGNQGLEFVVTPKVTHVIFAQAMPRRIYTDGRAFADFIEADQAFAVGEPRESSATKQALQINDEVELLRTHPADAGEYLRPVLRFAPAFALEADNASEVGIAFNERGERGINPPENF